MKTKVVELDPGSVSVYFLGDIHEGAANHQAKALSKAIDIIANDSNAYWIGMGDYIDAINHRDPRFNPLDRQLELLNEFLANGASGNWNEYQDWRQHAKDVVANLDLNIV